MPFGCVVVGAPLGATRFQSPVTAKQSIAATIEVSTMGIPILHAPNPLSAGAMVKQYLDKALERLKKHGANE